MPPQPVEPGSLVGELAMLIDHVYGATVVAEGRVHASRFRAPRCTRRCATDPALADHSPRL